MLVTPAAGQPARRAQAWLTYNVGQTITRITMNPEKKMKLGLSPDRDATIICICVALVTLPENPVLQFVWGFVVGFAKSFVHGF